MGGGKRGEIVYQRLHMQSAQFIGAEGWPWCVMHNSQSDWHDLMYVIAVLVVMMAGVVSWDWQEKSHMGFWGCPGVVLSGRSHDTVLSIDHYLFRAKSVCLLLIISETLQTTLFSTVSMLLDWMHSWKMLDIMSAFNMQQNCLAGQDDQWLIFCVEEY